MSTRGRLLIDPPYPGESLSSVVSRVAQTYAVSTYKLIDELVGSDPWSNRHRKDLDFDPPKSLEENLRMRVYGWTSPVRSSWSIHGKKILHTLRTAYCPLCFECDLVERRTPYFRLSWASAWTTICWKHRCPLMDWKDTSQKQYRKLPQKWIHGKFARSDDVPVFHLENRAVANEYFADNMRSFDRASLNDPDANTVLQLLWRLQCLLARPGEEMTDNPLPYRPSELQYRAYTVAHLGATQFAPQVESPAACAIYRVELSPLLSDSYDKMNVLTKPTSDRCIRNTSTVAWRRSYLWFAARTLATSRRFSRVMTGRERSECEWPDWWATFIPTLGEITAKHLRKETEQLIKLLGDPPTLDATA